LTYQHNGRIIVVNRGFRQAELEDKPLGFTYCRACNRWLVGEKAIEDHTGEDGQCPRHATAEQVLDGIYLYTDSRNDVVTIDCPLPEGASDALSFYTTLLHTFEQALVITLNLDESEVDGFLALASEGSAEERDERWRLILYETAEGGSGAVQSLTDPNRLRAVIRSARELLHEGEEGCERACYECLCTFYNQRDHELLDRTLVLPWLQGLEGLAVQRVQRPPAGPSFAELEAQCQSSFEREVLAAIRDRGLPLPEAAQKTIYDRDEPIATADFYYAPRILVFVDGSPHYRDYVQAADEHKRSRLKALAYRILVVTGDGLDEALVRLREWLGLV